MPTPEEIIRAEVERRLGTGELARSRATRTEVGDIIIAALTNENRDDRISVGIGRTLGEVTRDAVLRLHRLTGQHYDLMQRYEQGGYSQVGQPQRETDRRSDNFGRITAVTFENDRGERRSMSRQDLERLNEIELAREGAQGTIRFGLQRSARHPGNTASQDEAYRLMASSLETIFTRQLMNDIAPRRTSSSEGVQADRAQAETDGGFPQKVVAAVEKLKAGGLQSPSKFNLVSAPVVQRDPNQRDV